MDRIRVIVAETAESSGSPSGLLRAVLEHEGVQVAGEVFTRHELIELAADEQPDAVVFATRASQEELDRLRAVAPASKIVFVSPILVAAEAVMAEAVVERADVLASLGPVLVHLCAPGRVNARRALTESFDRPDWIDRVRKDPVTLREILSDGTTEESTERPSVTSLQGRARAADRAPLAPVDEDVVRLPDLEAGTEDPPMRRHTDRPAPPTPDRDRRRRWLGFWSVALAGLTPLCLWLLPTTVPAGLARAATAPIAPFSGEETITEGNDRPSPPPDRTPERTGDGARDPGGTPGDTPTAGSNGAGGSPAVDGGGSGGNDGGEPGVDPVDLPGASAEHNPHGGPPGQTGQHPISGDPPSEPKPSH